MEEDVSGASFSITDKSPQSLAKHLDSICPYYLSWGMSWDEFWFGSIDRLDAYWQANQFSIERRNEELWLQGMYIRIAVASCLDGKKVKYPDKAYRITAMTEDEKEAENQRKVAELRNALMEHKARWDAAHKEVKTIDGRKPENPG